MKVLSGTRPSPAMVLAALALVFAMVGTAVAGPDAISDKLNQTKVRSISKKQADKRLKANVSGSHVNLADNATDATNATNATNATTAANAQSLGGQAADTYQPKLLFAAVASGGTLIPERSRGATSVTKDAGAGTYRVFFNQTISACSTIATASNEGAAPETINTAIQGIPISGAGGTDNGVFLQTGDDAGALTDSGFHLLVTC